MGVLGVLQTRTVELVVASCVGYWVLALFAVVLRRYSKTFQRVAGYGRALDLHRPSESPLPKVFEPSVSKAAAFHAFYALGSVICAVAFCGSAMMHDRNAQLGPAVWMMFLHFQRRLWESLALQTMTGFTSPFAAMAGLSFYVYTPVSVLAASNMAGTKASTGWRWTGATHCFAAGQVGQMWAHIALECWKQRNGGLHRPLPHNELPFAISKVLHYRCEVLTYCGIALAVPGAEWLLLIPLFSWANLAVTAREAREWELRAVKESKTA